MKYWWKAPLVLAFPVWGVVLIIFLASQLPQSAETALLYLGGFGCLISAFPLFELKNTPFFIKIIMALAYYIVSAIVIFILGWASICWFYPSCH